MEFIETSLKDAYMIKPIVFRDERGFFLESYNKTVFAENGISAEFLQDNHSLSMKKGILRGLHFQLPPFEQAKLIRVIRGKIFDVIVDLRKNSSTFQKWESFELSSENFQCLFIPRGFAHGFVTLEENTEVIYKADSYYSKEHDSGILWNDSDLSIDWPIGDPILSEKDGKLQSFEEFENPF